MNPDAVLAELRHAEPTSGWKRTALVVAAAIGLGVAMRWMIAPRPYPLGLSVPDWFPLKPKLLPMVMRLVASLVPWVAAAGLAAVLMPRRKWLWAIGCAIGAVSAYHISGGVILHIALPPMPAPDAAMSRLSILADIFADVGSFAPPWEVVLMGAAYEMLFALVCGVVGAALVSAGTKLKDARQATQIAVGASAVVVLASAALVLQWIDRPPCRAAGADPGPIVEMRLVHEKPEMGDGLFAFPSVPLSPEPKIRHIRTKLPASEVVKMRLEDRGRMRGTDIMVHDRPGFVVSGTDIVGAEAGFASGYSVLVRLTADCSRKLEDFTRRNVGRRIAVIAYGRLLMAPTIAEPISGSIHLSVGLKKSDAIALAARINGREPPADDAK